MARTIREIEDTIILAVNADDRLRGVLDSTSKASVWRSFAFIVATAIFVVEKLFDLFTADVDAKLSQLKPHRKQWYRNKALAFQFGHDLVTDTDVYDNSGFTDEQIEASKIVKYAAATESDSRVILKIAGETGGKLQPLTNGQRNAFAAYMAEVKDAGVNLTVINYLPDLLHLHIRIFYDPLVLDATGNSIVNGGRPVEAAIQEYLRNLPFDGELVLAHLVDKLQSVPGVAIPDMQFAQSSWIDPESNGYGPVQSIDVKKIPESGYFEVVDFNNITYVANV